MSVSGTGLRRKSNERSNLRLQERKLKETLYEEALRMADNRTDARRLADEAFEDFLLHQPLMK